MKKAHEQISMEAEIQAQVRKAIQQGKGARFKDAVSMPSSPFDSASGMQQTSGQPQHKEPSHKVGGGPASRSNKTLQQRGSSTAERDHEPRSAHNAGSIRIEPTPIVKK